MTHPAFLPQTKDGTLPATSILFQRGETQKNQNISVYNQETVKCNITRENVITIKKILYHHSKPLEGQQFNFYPLSILCIITISEFSYRLS